MSQARSCAAACGDCVCRCFARAIATLGSTLPQRMSTKRHHAAFKIVALGPLRERRRESFGAHGVSENSSSVRSAQEGRSIGATQGGGLPESNSTTLFKGGCGRKAYGRVRQPRALRRRRHLICENAKVYGVAPLS